MLFVSCRMSNIRFLSVFVGLFRLPAVSAAQLMPGRKHRQTGCSAFICQDPSGRLVTTDGADGADGAGGASPTGGVIGTAGRNHSVCFSRFSYTTNLVIKEHVVVIDGGFTS